MGPEYGKIAIGVSAATGVVLVSFLLLKKFGFQDKSNARESKVRSIAEEDKPLLTEETGEKLATASLDSSGQFNGRHTSELQGFIDKGNEEEKINISDAGENQQSFILINDDEDVPENNAGGKKSDRSSDESSYDVIENDRLNDHVDDEDVGVGDDDVVAAVDEDVVALEEDAVTSEIVKAESGIKTEEDVNMSSMVFVEEPPFVDQDKSGSSLFVSVGELEKTDSNTVENQSTPSLIPNKEILENVAEDTGANNTEDVSENNSSSLQETIEHVVDETAPLIDALVSQELEAIENISRTLNEESRTQEDEAKIKDEEFRTSSEHKESVGDSQTVPITEELVQRTQAVLLSCQNTPGNVTRDDIIYLVELLSKNNASLQSTVLDCLTRVTAFTQNINDLRECGCPKILVGLVKDLVFRPDIDEKQLISVCNVLTNLSLDPKIKQELGEVLPELTRVIQSQGVSETLLLSALRTLVNLSSESDLHHLYSDLISTLYSLLCTASQPVRVLSVKVLVNLSLSGALVQEMLTAKAPASLIALLESSSQDLILRCVTLLSNLYSVICTTNTNPGDLEPETVQSILTNETNKSVLCAKALHLTRHDDEDLRYEASKLHNYLS